MVKLKKLTQRYFNILLIVFLGVVLASYTFCNRENKNEVLMELVRQTLTMYHFSPQDINDEFSNKVYDLYLKRVDFSKRFFTKEDLKVLSQYKSQIDDEIKSQSFEFYTKANEIFASNVDKIQGYYRDILSKPFTFNGNEEYQTDPAKSDNPKNDKELEEAWYNALKYQVLTRVSDALEIQNKLKKPDATSPLDPNSINLDETPEAPKSKTDTTKKTFAQLEEEARKSVLKLHDEWFKRIKQTTDTDRFSVYLNAIASVYDPHTQYMPPADEENFNISMSGQLEGIGALLQSSDGYTKIVSIVPGSPSWLQGELKPNDLILKVAQDTAEPVDIYDMPIDEVVKLIRGKKGTKVTLTVKKLDQSIKNITITRDIVILEETFAKSAIIDNGAAGKTGYIYLPKFYANFENKENGRSCAEDVLKEIDKLKDEKVNGIVLDLRNNGGGSLQDAINMAGLFIESGPIVQVKTSNNSPAKVYSDPDPEIHFKGALVILVNNFSASASEILAAAMQDYHRAIIMGSKSTFGKGTVQQIIDLDRMVMGSYQAFRPLGSLFVTIQKFYRINGGATQLKGVASDIVMPDPYSDLELGEREQDYCLPWTKIDPAKYTTWTGIPKFSEIVSTETQSINANPDFNIIKNEAEELKKQHDATLVSLNFKKYEQEEKDIDRNNKSYNDLLKKDNGLNIKMLLDDQKEMRNDTASMARMTSWIKDLKKDIYLKEAVKVVGMINNE